MLVDLLHRAPQLFIKNVRSIVNKGWELSANVNEAPERPLGWLPLYGPYYHLALNLKKGGDVWIVDLKVILEVWPDTANISLVLPYLGDPSVSTFFACVTGSSMGEPHRKEVYASRGKADVDYIEWDFDNSSKAGEEKTKKVARNRKESRL